ncbi:hypothetical protein I4U23_003851 [Adineta vaga]|nr:hypothetical protein I4U23_003851 [Adineta vaga]
MGNCHLQTRYLSGTILQYNIVRNSSSYTPWKPKDDENLAITFDHLVDHILLLRQVIGQPEMIHDEKLLNHSIKEYCQKMAREEILTEYRQSKLSLPILWIWHLHRLYPLTYYKDCTSQLPDGQLCDPSISYFPSFASRRQRSYMPFFPSVDLIKAALCQKTFLDKFKKHILYASDLSNIDRSFFPIMVNNYISFLQLGEENQILVPTFDIDLIWHTHLRNPTHYRQTSIELCGFVLNHDDTIKKDILKDAYKNTAQRWNNTYHTNYEQNHKTTLVVSSNSGGCGSTSFSITNIWRTLSESNYHNDGSDSADDGGSDCGGCSGD